MPAGDAAAKTALRLTWHSSPPIPGPIMGDIDVATATFRLSRLQVVGDGGTSGTTATDVQLAWTGTSPMPEVMWFEAAPLGLYSRVSIDLGADLTHNAFEITGSAKVAGNMEPFRIYDTEPLDISVDGYDIELLPGKTETLNIQLNLKTTLLAVKYNQLPVVAGVRTLGPNDSQINDVRVGLTDAFENP